MSYALKQWVYLETYVDDGEYSIENNRIERDIYPVTTSRKVRLFVDTQKSNYSLKTS
ncbi:IS66 family transposase [Vibrio campbellii]|uniref:IS66 family transposase n=1 Tax=Vibrio campbellii TaxID=680 RepID=UPI0009B8D9B0